MPPSTSKETFGSVLPAQQHSTGHWNRITLCLAAIVPALLQLFIVCRQQFPFPYQDDYPAVLGFALHYGHLHGMRDRLLYLIEAQHNEYKLLFEHLIVALELLVRHRVDFVALNLAGNAFVFLIGYVLWKMVSIPGETIETGLLRFVPISLIFFSANYWETIDWAMASLQNFPVIFWSLSAIYLLFAPQREASRANFPLGCMAAILAASSSANGFLLLPVGLIGLIPTRAYRKAAIWCGVFCLPLVAYLYHYSRVDHTAATSWPRLLLFFFAFLGSALPHRWLAAPLGMVLLGIVALAARSHFVRLQPAICLSVVWVLGTALLTSWVRGREAFYIASRYSIYSNLMLVFCFAFASWQWEHKWSTTERRKWYVSAVVVAALFCLATDTLAYRRLSARRHMVERGIAFYAEDPAAHSPMVDPAVERAFPKEKVEELRLMNEAIQQHVYRLPPTPSSPRAQ